MSHQYESPKPQWLKRAAGIGLTVIAFFLVKAVVGAGIGYANSQSVSAADFERQIASSPEIAPLFNQIKESYPEEYRQFIDMMIANAREGISASEARRQGAQFTRSLVISKVNEISKAPADDLRRLARAQLEFAEHLEIESLPLCALYAMAGISPQAVLTPEATRLLSEVGRATILAASAGERNPSNRPIGDLTDSDAEAWVVAILASGGTERTLAAFANPNSISQQEQCDLGQLAYKGALALPDEEMARVVGFLMRQAATMPLPR